MSATVGNAQPGDELVLSGQRDPRKDPVKGDVTVSLNNTRYTITRVTDGDVHYHSTESGNDFCSLQDWRQWSKNDTVAHAVSMVNIWLEITR